MNIKSTTISGQKGIHMQSLSIHLEDDNNQNCGRDFGRKKLVKKIMAFMQELNEKFRENVFWTIQSGTFLRVLRNGLPFDF